MSYSVSNYSFGKLAFVHEWRTKRQKLDNEPLPSIEMKKKSKYNGMGLQKVSSRGILIHRIKGGRKMLMEPPLLPDGRKCVRTIRFERSEGDSMYKRREHATWRY